MVTRAHLGQLRHELNVSDDIRQHSAALGIDDAVGGIRQPVEGLFEPGVLLESAWVVRISL